MGRYIHKAKGANYKLDLIVLSYNGIETTKKFLDHYYKNTDTSKVHLIWIDNASTDDTRKFLKEIFADKKEVTYFEAEKNLGVIDGRNKGYKISEGRENKSPYIMYLDNDQYVLEGWLDHHFAVLHSGYDMIGVEAWQLNYRFIPIAKVESLRNHFSYVGCGGMLIKRAVTDRIKMFDKQFNPAYFEDPDFNFRAIQAGFKVGWNFKAKIFHLPHQTLGKNATSEKTRIFTESLNKFRKKWHGHRPPVLKQRNLPELF